MNTWSCTALLMGLLVWSGIVSAFDKEAIYATSPVEISANSPSPSDLERDMAFGNSGSVMLDYNSGNDKDDRGLRIVNSQQGRYHVLGRHARGDGTWDATIARIDGATGAVQKWWRVPTGMAQINDAAARSSDSWDNMRLYFVGAARPGSTGSLDFAVTCVHVRASTAQLCENFGSNGKVTIPFNLGGGNDDIATRVFFRTAEMWIAGTAQSANNTKRVAVAKFSSDTLDTSFGTSGKWTRNFGGPANVDVQVDDLQLQSSQSRLYISGSFRETRSTGYVLAIDSHTAAVESQFGGFGLLLVGGGAYCHPCDNNAVTALRPLPNGHLLMAGWGGTTDGKQVLVMVRVNAAAEHDMTLCGTPICVPVTDNWGGSSRDVPVSIAVRNDPNESGDIVVAMTRDYDYDLEPSTYQSVHQYRYRQTGSALMRPVAYTNIIGRPAGAPGEYVSTASAADMLVESGVTYLVGSSFFQGSDYDVMVSRMYVNNSIFSASFGHYATGSGD